MHDIWLLGILILLIIIVASLGAQRLKHLPPMRETWVWSLGQEDPLEKEMATHSSILAWRIPWAEELGRLQSMGLQRVGHDWATVFNFFFSFYLLTSSPISLNPHTLPLAASSPFSVSMSSFLFVYFLLFVLDFT